jgi:hypothetical protein
MYPMRFPPFLFFILAALIVFGGVHLLFKLVLIAALFMFFGKFFGFGRWGYPGQHRPGGYRGHGRGFGPHGHSGHPGRGGYGHHGHHGRPHRRGPRGWDWDDEEVEVTDSDSQKKKKNAPQNDDTIDAEAWV